MHMRVDVRLFARLRELAASEAVSVEVGLPTVRAVLGALTVRIPEASQLIARSVLAVNGEYAADDYLLTESDEVALIPPVSGG